MNKVLVVAVHPDDETLGCGGTLLKHKDQGDEIYWLIVTHIHEAYGWDKEREKRTIEEIKKVSKLYNFNKTINLKYKTTLDNFQLGEIISNFAKVFNEIKPNIVYLPNRSDVHSDHKIAFQTAYNCTKNFRYPFVKKILMCETISETDFAPALSENVFIPNVFVDIEEYFEKKMEIMQVYESEIMPENFPRSIETIKALSIYRGSRIGKKYAEAFQLIHEEK